jgi:subtilisin-like proprotein convertase family protein
VAPGVRSTVLLQLDGIEAGGNWKMRITDLTAGDGGTIEIVV